MDYWDVELEGLSKGVEFEDGRESGVMRGDQRVVRFDYIYLWNLELIVIAILGLKGEVCIVGENEIFFLANLVFVNQGNG